MSELITVEVVFALPEVQHLETVSIPVHSTLADALEASGVMDNPLLSSEPDLSFGIWGQSVSRDHRLKHGDRVEIYRPLNIDPKEARRKLASVGRTMGARKTGQT